jgi:hypothetical protein
MRSIFERLCRYFGSLTRRSRERAPGEGTEPPHPFEETRGIRTAPADPYAEMRKALAITMLLG